MGWQYLGRLVFPITRPFCIFSSRSNNDHRPECTAIFNANIFCPLFANRLSIPADRDGGRPPKDKQKKVLQLKTLFQPGSSSNRITLRIRYESAIEKGSVCSREFGHVLHTRHPGEPAEDNIRGDHGLKQKIRNGDVGDRSGPETNAGWKDCGSSGRSRR